MSVNILDAGGGRRVPVSRRSAIKAGADHFTVLLLALLASAVPVATSEPPAPVLPDWLQNVPPGVLASLERIVGAGRQMPQDGEVTFASYLEITARIFEGAAGGWGRL